MKTKTLVARFTEAFDAEIAADRIDEAAGRISNVKVVGFTSRNGREYLPEALQQATKIYEGSKVYVDHKVGGRSLHERWGKLVNLRFVPASGVYADLDFLKTSPITPAILESIRRFGDSGLSHDAEGIVESRGGKNVVTKLEKIHSVDFVENPATNSNLFESVQMKKKILAVLREGIDQKVVAVVLASLTESKLVTEEHEFEPSSDAKQVLEAVGAAVSLVVSSSTNVDEAVKSLSVLFGGSTEELTAKVKEQSEAIDLLTKENTQLKEATQKASDRIACEKLLESMGREVTDVRVEGLMALPADKRSRLAESWAAKATRPDKSPSKFKESNDDSSFGDLPTGDSFKKAVLGV